MEARSHDCCCGGFTALFRRYIGSGLCSFSGYFLGWHYRNSGNVARDSDNNWSSCGFGGLSQKFGSASHECHWCSIRIYFARRRIYRCMHCAARRRRSAGRYHWRMSLNIDIARQCLQTMQTAVCCGSLKSDRKSFVGANGSISTYTKRRSS